MMKTYAIRLKKETTIEGVQYPADFQIAALTSEVGPLTILGLVQYRHAIVDEVTDSLDDESDASADGDDGEPEAGESVTPQPGDEIDSNPPDEESPATPPAVDQQGADGGELSPVVVTNDSAVTAFVAAGLDQKTAEALVIANKITSIEELTTLLADPGFDLIDLDDIGVARAEKIKAVFLTPAA